MLTVHMIGNAHLDPVWLWRWPAGLGEALATCRTACDLLDEHSDLVFTRSDVWVYQQLEQVDPALFERVRRHVHAGRWAVVGGWYVQPDCNFPSEESFLRHIASGRRYFRERFGTEVTVGYNVDSFGHAASLPRILAEHGYDAYVMMRPMQHEKSLPASLFRWRSTEDAGGVREVLTWRIARAYCASEPDLTEQVSAAMASAVPGVDHVMCFYGVGDHGGGPTRAQIAWIRRNQGSFGGARLVFSHPRAFFDAVAPLAALLPVVNGELQHHAVGCYSVGSSIKAGVRAAEQSLLMAERALVSLGEGTDPRGTGSRMEHAWESVMFCQFHDIYGGTVIPSAEQDAVAQCAGARDAAQQVLFRALFRGAAALPSDPCQRLVAFNASDVPFDGFLETEPWLGDWKRLDHWLADDTGTPVPFQRADSASIAMMPGTLVWPARLEPGEIRAWTLRPAPAPARTESDVRASESEITNRRWTIAPGAGTTLFAVAERGGGASWFASGGPRLAVQEDVTDTWSHGVDRYSGTELGSFQVRDSMVEESGPVRACLRLTASFGESSAVAWVYIYRGDPRLRLRIRVHWRERLRILKLVLPLAMTAERKDGIPGGAAVRPQDGRESPVVDWTLAALESGGSLGIALPDCSALDGTPQRLRITLLRSPAYAWHDPARIPDHRAVRWMEQGEHEFTFVFVPDADAAAIRREALGLHRPPPCIGWTRGMEDRERS